MGNILQLDYYYGKEAEQFSFYRVPKLLIKDERFKDLSSDAKLLYGLMLDRMALSLKNGWLDDENRAYIYYSLDDIMDDLGCAKEKSIKILKELDSKHGLGLIEKKRQGLGKPDIIYVKNFATLKEDDEAPRDVSDVVPEDALEEKNKASDVTKSPSNTDVSTEVRKSNFKKFEKQTSRSSETETPEVRKTDFKKFENQNSRSSETETPEVRYTNTNYNNYNNSNMNYNNPINPSMQEEQPKEWIDEMDMISSYIEIIRKNIDYDSVMQHSDNDFKEIYDELYDIICETVCVNRKTVKIGGEDYPYELVKNKFLKLNYSHLQYVIYCLNNNTTKVSNIKAYLLTTLFNAPSTIKHYYQQAVQHDMWGK